MCCIHPHFRSNKFEKVGAGVSKNCVYYARLPLRWYTCMWLTGTHGENAKFGGRNTLVYRPFSHIYIYIYIYIAYMPLCALYGAFHISIVLCYLGIFTSITLIISVPSVITNLRDLSLFKKKNSISCLLRSHNQSIFMIIFDSPKQKG